MALFLGVRQAERRATGWEIWIMLQKKTAALQNYSGQHWGGLTQCQGGMTL